jgi:hypothetical protein
MTRFNLLNACQKRVVKGREANQQSQGIASYHFMLLGWLDFPHLKGEF